MRVDGQLKNAQAENKAAAPVVADFDGITIPKGLFYFDTVLNQTRFWNGSSWQAVGSSSGSGGSGSLNFHTDPGGPIQTTEFGESVYLFQKALTQPLKVYIRVPGTYTSGNQILMKLPIYSPTSNGTSTMRLESIAYLIAKNSSAVNSTTNSNASTNTALTNGGTANVYREVSLDITDTVGKINSVSVAAGDLIKVEITRDDTDTDTEDLRLIPHGAELTF